MIKTTDQEECWNCGLPLGDHEIGEPCPDELDLQERYGYR